MLDNQKQWLHWAREIQALAQTGYHYAQNEFERSRAKRLREIAAEIVAAHSQMAPAEVSLAFNSQPGYVTPKVDVRGAVYREHQLLFVREAMDGCWTLPGGWADVGETPRTAVEREVLEETGMEVRASRLVGVYDANRIEGALSLFHAYKLVFLCELISGQPRPSLETSEVCFFPVDALPQPLSNFRTTPRHIQDVLNACQKPSQPTIFD